LLSGRGVLEQWYEYELKAEEAALRDWCNLNSIELTDWKDVPQWNSQASIFKRP